MRGSGSFAVHKIDSCARSESSLSSWSPVQPIRKDEVVGFFGGFASEEGRSTMAATTKAVPQTTASEPLDALRRQVLELQRVSSLGVLAGASLGALAAGLTVDPLAHFAAVASSSRSSASAATLYFSVIGWRFT